MGMRQPLLVFVGHVDAGKTSIQDYIRRTTVAAAEPGAITQHIGCSTVPLDTIKKVSGKLLEKVNMDFTVPGIVMIDSPGHAAFTNLRKRGGNLADIGVLVVNINEGFKPQTIEALEILKSYKTPFIIAANKIDLLPGWQRKNDLLIENIGQQSPQTVQAFETKLYEIVGQLHEHGGMNGERFDRVSDYTQQIAIVPLSAKTGEGIPELLMVLCGLAQRFLDNCLKCDVEGDAKGTVLEVKEEKGIGTSADVIIYDGTLRVNDPIVIGGLNAPIKTKVRALFEPNELSEIRDKKTKFKSVKEVSAACGVKISAPDLKEVVAGMPIRSCCAGDIDSVGEEIQEEVEEVIVETDDEGIIVKADTLGSLEAVITLLKEKEIPVKKASVGNITRKDVIDAEVNDPLDKVVIGFNVTDESGVVDSEAVAICDSVIYTLLEKLEEWRVEEEKRQQLKKLGDAVFPCKIKLMENYVFRQSNPAIIGVDILAGSLRVGMPLMTSHGKEITSVKQIQLEKENKSDVESGKQVAASLLNVTVGRQIHEGDTLYSSLSEKEFRKLKEYKEHLTGEQKTILKEIAEIMRRDNPVWGV